MPGGRVSAHSHPDTRAHLPCIPLFHSDVLFFPPEGQDRERSVAAQKREWDV